MSEYIIGATGSGKSTYIEYKISRTDRPIIFIDKHGDSAKRIADSQDDLKYWRPTLLDYIVGFNPLQSVQPDDRWRLVQAIISFASDVWQLGTGTPRLLYLLRNSLRLLLDTPGTTLLDLRPLLTDRAFRTVLLRNCDDPVIRQTFKEYDALKPDKQMDWAGSVVNKIDALIAAEPLRYILGQTSSTIDIEECMRLGKNIILDLDGLDGEPGFLLGALLIHAVHNAARKVRKPYYLIIDEFQNFGTSIIETILAEDRKFGLDLILAHQFISQIDPQIRDAVLGNCSTKVCFRVGPNDAPIMGDALDWNPRDLQNQGVGVARYTALINGAPSNALQLDYERPHLATGYLRGNLNARKAFSRPRKLVEKMMRERQ